MLLGDEASTYEKPLFSHRAMLEVCLLKRHQLEFWARHDFFRIRTWRGKPRLYSMADCLYLRLIGTLALAGVSLEAAAGQADVLFPDLAMTLTLEVSDLLRGACVTEPAVIPPSTLAIFCESACYIARADEMHKQTAAVFGPAAVPGELDCSIVINLSRMINVTHARARGVLARRGAPSSAFKNHL
jgi:hypothetical protein